MASLLLALHPAAFFSPAGRLSAATRVSAPTMVDADVQTQIEQLQAKLEIMRLKAQLEELQRQAVAPPAPVVPEVVVAAPPALAQAEPIASAAAAVARQGERGQPITSAWSTLFPLPNEAQSAAADPLQAALRQQAVDADTASSAASAAALAAAKGWTGNAAEAAASQAASKAAEVAASASAKGWTVPPASDVLPVPAEAATYAATIAAQGMPNMLPLGIVLSLPIGFLVGKSLISFINERYEEIKGGEDQSMPGNEVNPAKSFADAALTAVGWKDAVGDSGSASLQGTMFANDGMTGGGGGGVAPPPLRYSEEQEALEVARASSWYAEQSPDGRSAQDIFFSGVQNLMDDQVTRTRTPTLTLTLNP